MWCIAVVSLAVSACGRSPRAETATAFPQLLGWHRTTPEIYRRLVIGQLTYRAHLFPRRTVLVICLPTIPRSTGDSVRHRLADSRVVVRCPARPSESGPDEQLLVESVVVEGDSLVMDALRVAPGESRPSWRETHATFRDFLPLGMRLTSQLGAVRPSLPKGVETAQDSLLLSYLAIRRQLGAVGSDTVCVTVSSADQRRRMRSLLLDDDFPAIQLADSCTQFRDTRLDELDVAQRHDTLVVRVSRGVDAYPRGWVERFSLSSSGIWSLVVSPFDSDGY